MFLGVALQVVLSVRSRERTRVEQMFGWLKGSATLLCLLGVTWIFGYLMVIQGAHTVFAYIFTVLNCLQVRFNKVTARYEKLSYQIEISSGVVFFVCFYKTKIIYKKITRNKASKTLSK